jgi:hypothetical protein
MFLWSGSKLFPVVAVYNPEDGQNDEVNVIHFASDHEVLYQACERLVMDYETPEPMNNPGS